ncbi:MAG: hypothetical protein JRD93_07345 [Deltaproteobacteria bacterium]|nr:hypothetical protein [Deltaproteobacteria bacterium]
MADIKRVNYFTHQFLVEKDFDDEQDYHNDMRRRHNRVNHSWGVADGLDVTKTKDKEVTISKGTAIDKDGQEIVLLEPLPVDLTAFGSNTDVYLSISYQEVFDEADHYTSGGIDNYTRTTERPKLESSSDAPDPLPGDGSFITLARVHLDGSGNVDAGIDNTMRKSSGSKIAPGAVSTNELANNAVTNTKIANGQVGASELANGSVTNTKLASNAVTATKIANNSVTAAKIANGQVGASELANGSVTNTKLASNAVTAAKIANGQVGASELANGSVTNTKLANKTITISKLDNEQSYNGTYSVGANGIYHLNLSESDDEHAFYLVSVYCVTNNAEITWEWRLKRYTVGGKIYFNRRVVIRNLTNITASFRAKIYRIMET